MFLKHYRQKIVGLVIALCFIIESSMPPSVCAAVYDLPQPGSLLNASAAKAYPALKGIKVDIHNPFHLEFVVDTQGLKSLKQEDVAPLVEYFLAVLTTPDSDLWVNLSPYESERIICDSLSTTEMGKGLLAQDYVLKQLASSLTYPETPSGKAYWDLVSRQEKGDRRGSFTKVWITPDKALIKENGNIALIAESSLNVLTQEDFLAAQKNNLNITANEPVNKAASKAFKQFILPQISKDVNSGSNFNQLRQIYSAFILATWFKRKLKDSIYRYYINQNKVQGIALDDKDAKEKIYGLYVEAFKKGAYNYTERQKGTGPRSVPISGKVTKRTYFSGGALLDPNAVKEKAVPKEDLQKSLSPDAKVLDVSVTYNRGMSHPWSRRNTPVSYPNVGARYFAQYQAESSKPDPIKQGDIFNRLLRSNWQVTPRRNAVDLFVLKYRTAPAKDQQQQLQRDKLLAGLSSNESLSFLVEIENAYEGVMAIAQNEYRALRGLAEDSTIPPQDMRDLLRLGYEAIKENMLDPWYNALQPINRNYLDKIKNLPKHKPLRDEDLALIARLGPNDQKLDHKDRLSRRRYAFLLFKDIVEGRTTPEKAISATPEGRDSAAEWNHLLELYYDTKDAAVEAAEQMRAARAAQAEIDVRAVKDMPEPPSIAQIEADVMLEMVNYASMWAKANPSVVTPSSEAIQDNRYLRGWNDDLERPRLVNPRQPYGEGTRQFHSDSSNDGETPFEEWGDGNPGVATRTALMTFINQIGLPDTIVTTPSDSKRRGMSQVASALDEVTAAIKKSMPNWLKQAAALKGQNITFDNGNGVRFSADNVVIIAVDDLPGAMEAWNITSSENKGGPAIIVISKKLGQGMTERLPANIRVSGIAAESGIDMNNPLVLDVVMHEARHLAKLAQRDQEAGEDDVERDRRHHVEGYIEASAFWGGITPAMRHLAQIAKQSESARMFIAAEPVSDRGFHASLAQKLQIRGLKGAVAFYQSAQEAFQDDVVGGIALNPAMLKMSSDGSIVFDLTPAQIADMANALKQSENVGYDILKFNTPINAAQFLKNI